MLNIEVVSTIAFFAIVGILLIIDRKNIKFHYGVITRRWESGKELIDKFVKRRSKFLTIFGTVGIVVGLIASIFTVGLLVFFSFTLEQAFAPVLPTAGGFKYPGPIVSIPFWYWIITIFVVITSHEPMHAIFSRLAKIPLRSYGIATFLVLPIGAFVDPDMNKIKKLSLLKKLRIYTGGSFGNIIVSLIVLGLYLLIATQLIVPTGVGFKELVNNTPAFYANISGIITSVDGHEIKNTEDLSNILQQTTIGKEIDITTSDGNYKLKTTNRPDDKLGSYIGISMSYTVIDVIPILQNYKTFVFRLGELLFWLFAVSLGVGMFNMLPLKPLDGGYVFEEIFDRIFKNKGKIIVNVLSIIIFGLILFNIFGIGLIKSFI